MTVHQPIGERRQRHGSDQQQRADPLAAFLPHQDAEHDAAHAEDGEDGTHGVDATRSGIGHIGDEFDAGKHDGDDDDLEQEPDAPRHRCGDEAAEQRSHRRGDRRGRPDQCVDLLLGRPFEVAVDERLHGGQQERRPEAPEDGPADDHRRQALVNIIATAPTA